MSNYIIFINILLFILFGIDKYFAKRKLWRIPEIILFILAILGGTCGGMLAMKLFHHKTLKKNFSLVFIIIFIIQIILLFYILMD